MLHIVDVRGVSSPSLTAKVVERMLTRSASTWGSARSLSSAVLRTAVNKMLNSIGARTHPWRRPWPTSNYSPIQSYARSHPIVELAHDIDHHRRHPKSGENNPEKGAVDRTVRFLEVHEVGV